MARRTIVYVDGFNLYYGALQRTPYRWLDLLAFSKAALGKAHDVTAIKYFTARIKQRYREDSGPARQDLYLRALRTIPNLTIYEGHFLEHRVLLPQSSSAPGKPDWVEVVRTDEKGSDVSLATELVADSYEMAYEAAVVVTNDSDQAPAIRLVTERHHVPVGVIVPLLGKGRPSAELMRYASFRKEIRTSTLAESQFPYELRDQAGKFWCPAEWRRPE